MKLFDQTTRTNVKGGTAPFWIRHSPYDKFSSASFAFFEAKILVHYRY